MPLVVSNLAQSLNDAFAQAMLTFEDTIKNSPPLTDVSEIARTNAALKFASIAAPAIDLYIKSATIITPPGQAVALPDGAGVTVTPSSPATIS